MSGDPVTYVDLYLAETATIAQKIDRAAVAAVIAELVAVRERGGRLFLAGSGGGAGHASHAAADFRKLAGIEAYAIADNVSELTARVNDDGWASSYAEWLRASRIGSRDMLLVLSVGGGDKERGVSPNLVECIELARSSGARVAGFVGRDGGTTARLADACVIVPTVRADAVTPHVEGMQAVLWHLVVSHPALLSGRLKWESLA